MGFKDRDRPRLEVSGFAGALWARVHWACLAGNRWFASQVTYSLERFPLEINGTLSHTFLLNFISG